MTQLQFNAMPTEVVRQYQSGQIDANGQVPVQYIHMRSSTHNCYQCRIEKSPKYGQWIRF